eukprot:TRINITY_DN15078_c0_g1_i1.p1 TRINITY_DN15078_c0_g1~~TRINITY_DN15078_c0_g1_i1.p1  ORF type:complete len:442 (+),score=50.06 TRINITY_DN15078_c0_g1_i1:85-1326(+)
MGSMEPPWNSYLSLHRWIRIFRTSTKGWITLTEHVHVTQATTIQRPMRRTFVRGLRQSSVRHMAQTSAAPVLPPSPPVSTPNPFHGPLKHVPVRLRESGFSEDRSQGLPEAVNGLMASNAAGLQLQLMGAAQKQRLEALVKSTVEAAASELIQIKLHAETAIRKGQEELAALKTQQASEMAKKRAEEQTAMQRLEATMSEVRTRILNTSNQLKQDVQTVQMMFNEGPEWLLTKLGLVPILASGRRLLFGPLPPTALSGPSVQSPVSDPTAAPAPATTASGPASLSVAALKASPLLTTRKKKPLEEELIPAGAPATAIIAAAFPAGSSANKARSDLASASAAAAPTAPPADSATEAPNPPTLMGRLSTAVFGRPASPLHGASALHQTSALHQGPTAEGSPTASIHPVGKPAAGR